MRKEYYDIHKKLGICTHCGKNKAQEGRVLCAECAEKDANKKRNYNKERKKAYNKRKRDLCDAFGICTVCMKREKYKGKRCIECYLKGKKRYKEQQLDAGKIPKNLWSEFGLCLICGQPRAEGHKMCEKHLKIYRKNAQNARKYIDKEHHIWREVTYMEIKRLQSLGRS